MKLLAGILFVLMVNTGFAQKRGVDFSLIDHQVWKINASSPDTLAYLLTTAYTTDLQKVRSIFRWITENIAYKTTGRYKKPVPVKNVFYEEDEDTGALKPLNLRVAENVLRKREAVCDGYARLFKTLCDYAGIPSEIITGFARADNRGSMKFRSNHLWNAVSIDGEWHLLDATWASGFISFGGDFVRHFDESYFLTPPKQFIQDHFPEDLKWTLLEDPPTLREFHQSPFKHTAFIRHKIVSYKPSNGIIEAAVGDKIVFELETAESGKDLVVASSGTIADSLLLPALFLSARPGAAVSGNRLSYTFTVQDPSEKWLQIIYKGDVVLRYKLRIKKDIAVR